MLCFSYAMVLFSMLCLLLLTFICMCMEMLMYGNDLTFHVLVGLSSCNAFILFWCVQLNYEFVLVE